MTRGEAYEYWRYKYEMAKDFDDPRWEGGEIREFRRYVDALATIVKMLEPPTCIADRIRSMSDEELADLLTAVAKKSAEMLCKSLKTVEVDLSECDFEILTKTHLSWLKSPVEEIDE